MTRNGKMHSYHGAGRERGCRGNQLAMHGHGVSGDGRECVLHVCVRVRSQLELV